MESLFLGVGGKTLRKMTTSGTLHRRAVIAADLAEHAEDVVRARERLCARLMETFEGAVTRASEAGERHARVFTFRGADKFEDRFFVLYLLVGPRPHGNEGREYARRVGSGLDRLRELAAPFEVWHARQPGTDENHIMVAW